MSKPVLSFADLRVRSFEKWEFLNLCERFAPESRDYFLSISERSAGFNEGAAGAFLMAGNLKALGFDPGEIIIKRNSEGRPYIENNMADFSVSHSGNHVMCAAALNGRIGCDIQVIKPYPDEKRDKLAEYFMTAEEIEQYKAAEDKDEFYCRLWTEKEALLKCRSGSVWDDLKKIKPKSGFVNGRIENALWSYYYEGEA